MYQVTEKRSLLPPANRFLSTLALTWNFRSFVLLLFGDQSDFGYTLSGRAVGGCWLETPGSDGVWNPCCARSEFSFVVVVCENHYCVTVDLTTTEKRRCFAVHSPSCNPLLKFKGSKGALFSHCCDKMPNGKQLKGEQVFSAHS